MKQSPIIHYLFTNITTVYSSWPRGGRAAAGAARRVSQRAVTERIHASVHGSAGESRFRGQVPPQQGSESDARDRGEHYCHINYVYSTITILIVSFLKIFNRMASRRWLWRCSRATTRWSRSCWRTTRGARFGFPHCT